MLLYLGRIEPQFKDKVVAVVHITKNEDGRIEIEVESKNPTIRSHVVAVLSTPFYQISPISRKESTAVIHSLFVKPNSKEFILYLRDRLGWYGYTVTKVGAVAKSISAEELSEHSYFDWVMKNISAGASEYIRPSVKGDGYVVTRVPAGYMAVSNDGRVVGPGKFLNAKIGTPDARWQLVPYQPKGYRPSPGPEKLLQTHVEKWYEEFSKPDTDEKKKQKFREKLQKVAKVYFSSRGQAEANKNAHIVAALADILGEEKYKREKAELDEKELSAITEEFKEAVTESVGIAEVFKDLGVKELDDFVASVTETVKRLAVDPSIMVDSTTVSEEEFAIDEKYAGYEHISGFKPDNYLVVLREKGTNNFHVFVGTKISTYLANKTEKFPDYKYEARFYDLSKFKQKLSDEEILKRLKEVIKKKKSGEKVEKLGIPLGMIFRALGRNKGGIGSFKGYETLKELAPIDDALPLTDESFQQFRHRLNSSAVVKDIPESKYAPIKEEFYYHWKPKPDEYTLKKRVEDLKETLESKYKDENGYFKKPVEGSDEWKELAKEPQDIVNEIAKEIGLKTVGKPRWRSDIYPLSNPKRGGPYQSMIVRLMGDPRMYGPMLGPNAHRGFLLNAEQGAGKTVMAAAAIEVLKSVYPQHFVTKVGNKTKKRTTLIISPVQYNWRDTIMDATGLDEDNVVVIDGTREERISKYEEIADRINSGNAPEYIIVGVGKVRGGGKKGVPVTAEGEEGEEQAIIDEREFESVDMKYLKMFATGFKNKETGKVATNEGAVAVLTIDEMALYLNHKSKRGQLMRQLADMVAANRGIIFGLEGRLMKNDVADFLKELEFVSNEARDIAKEEFASNKDRNRKGPDERLFITAKNKNKKLFRDPEAMRTLTEGLTKNQAFVPAKAIAGVKESKIRNAETVGLGTISPQLTTHFANEALRHAVIILAKDIVSKFSKKIGLMQKAQREDVEKLLQSLWMGTYMTALNASYGAIEPRQVFEYDSDFSKFLLNNLKSRLVKEFGEEKGNEYFDEFTDRLNAYLNENTYNASASSSYTYLNAALTALEAAKKILMENNPKLAKKLSKIRFNRMPIPQTKGGKDPQKRAKEWESLMVSSDGKVSFKEILDDIVKPAAKDVAKVIGSRVESQLTGKSKSGIVKKMVVATPSRKLARAIGEFLQERLEEKGVHVAVIDGTVPNKERHEIEKAHAQSDQSVVVISQAGATGLNLDSDKVIRTPFFTPAIAEQAESRAQRNLNKVLPVDVINLGGYVDHVWSVEEFKRGQAEMLEEVLQARDLEDVDYAEILESYMSDPRSVRYLETTFRQMLKTITKPILGVGVEVPKLAGESREE